MCQTVPEAISREADRSPTPSELTKSVQGVRQVRARVRKPGIEVLFDAAALEVSAIAEQLRNAG